MESSWLGPFLAAELDSVLETASQNNGLQGSLRCSSGRPGEASSSGGQAPSPPGGRVGAPLLEERDCGRDGALATAALGIFPDASLCFAVFLTVVTVEVGWVSFSSAPHKLLLLSHTAGRGN